MQEQTSQADDYDTFDGTCDDAMDFFIEAVGNNDNESGFAGEIAARCDDFQRTAGSVLDDTEAVIAADFAAYEEAVNTEFGTAYSSAWDKIVRLRSAVDARLSP